MTLSKDIRRPARIDSLTGARFFAILIIVLCHFEFLGNYGSFGTIYYQYLRNPTMGVDFFFMLSGFGMMLSSIRRDPDGIAPIGGFKGLLGYGIMHISKIYPTYVAFLLFGLPCSILVRHYSWGIQWFPLVFQQTLFFFLDLTLLQSLTGILKISHSINSVCWFLSSLFCIYLVCPILLKYLKKRIKTVPHALLGISLSVLGSIIFAILFTLIENHSIQDSLCYTSPFRRVFYVITGMLVAQIYNKSCIENTFYMPSFITDGTYENVVIILSIIWFFLRMSVEQSLGSLIYVLDMAIVACDLLALSIGNGLFSKLFSKKPIVYLGNISMYIFLSHYNIRMLTVFIFEQLHLESLAIAILEIVIILTLTMITSVLLDRKSRN